MALLDLSRAPHGGSQRHLPEWDQQPKIIPTTIIDHSIVGSGEAGFRHFRDTSALESHFIVCGAGDVDDGWIWQLMDTSRQADANLRANDYAISIETGDQGDPDRQPWSDRQLAALQWLHNELVRVHPTIPRRLSRSCLDPAGLGYHTLHGAPSCWTPVAKSCPGMIRKDQWWDRLLPAFQFGQEVQDDMFTDDDRKLLAQIATDVAALKQETVLTRPGQATMDGVWYAWRRLNWGTETLPPAEERLTYSLKDVTERLARLEELVAPPPPPP